MITKKNEVFSELSKSISKAQIKFKGFLRSKFREHEIDITFEMLQILMKLWNEDRVNQQELANFTFKDKASLTYLIDNLSKRDLVERQEDANDRRNKLIVLKPEGRKLKNIIMPWIDEMYTVAGAGISTDMLKSGIDLFAKIHSNLNREGD
jgi:DNA-binding MarR family transcriptional regulator